MSSWMNEAAVQNHNGNGFPHINDPNATVGGMMDPSAFVANAAQFNPASANQFNTPQQMMAMQNGAMRNASPSSFSNPMYQTNSVIPSKRSRPRDDGLAASPRQNSGMLPTSRSGTPQQAHFPAYPPGSLPQQNTPQAYPHMPPNGSANATPSPIMSNQIRSGSVPQRVSTTSPHPFSPAATQSFAPQASPVPSEAVPQPNAYVQPNAFPPGFNPNFPPQSSPARPSPNPGMPQQMQMPQQMPPQMGQMGQMGQMSPTGAMGPGGQMGQMSPIHQMNPMNPMGQMGHAPNQMLTPQMQQQLAQARNPLEQQKLLYQMQVQRHLQQGNMQGAPQMQAQSMPGQQRNIMARQQGPPNGQVPPGTPGGMKPSQQPPTPLQQNAPRTGSDQFFSQLSLFMNRRNLPLEINPIAGDRPVNLVVLFQAVQKFNGYRHVSQSNMWPQICHTIGLSPAQVPSAPAQVKQIYERNLLKFEEFWVQTRAKATQQQQQQMQQPPPQSQAQQQPQQQQQQQPPQPQQMQQMQQPPHMQQPQPGQQDPMNLGAVPGTPKPTMPSQMLSGQQRMTPGQVPSVKHLPPNGQQPAMNGVSTPNAGPGHAQSNSGRGSMRNSTPRSMQDAVAQEEFGTNSPTQSRAGVATPQTTHAEPHASVTKAVNLPASMMMDSDEYKPCSRESHTYGGIDVNAPGKVVADILRFRPDVPAPQELGNIDIHALTRSIQSGIRSEVRLALDTLATVTVCGLPGLDIELDKCDDLLDSIIDYAEELVELLAESSPEVSDEILILPYEDIARACQVEKLAVRSLPEVGSEEEELDRSVEYLLCITVILRNLSFNPRNQQDLADEGTIRFICQVIRYIGTRNMLLRTQLNTLDFLKDIIVFLSNVSGSVEISDRDQALCLLQFLLAFAPSPSPSLSDSHIFFPTFQPAVQPYLPPAVDALAKLLARDEPNRTHFRNLFTMDANSPTSCDLLTRTFSLAISPIPEHVREARPRHLPPIVEIRKPILMQGLLAADIVASLAPDHESGVARAWLSSDNGFAQNLHRSIRDLCHQYESAELHARNYRFREPPRKDAELMYIVVLAISLLRKLSDKAIDPDDPKSTLPPNVLPSDEGLLEALAMISGEWSRDGFLQHLVAFASLDE